jgi:two-component system, OmpR family, response regulator
MLVLSRNEGEGIIFPELDLAVEILRVAGTRIRVGVQAPEDIRVLRSELADRSKAIDIKLEDRNAAHALRNRLNSAGLALMIAQKHLERGDLALAEAALQRTLQRLVIAPDATMPEENLSDTSSTRNRGALETDMHSRARHARVLLVEDNRSECSLLAELLRLSGISVETAGNGNEAIERMLNKLPDVVLLDMQMPECDGPETIRRIREIPTLQNVAIYAVTGKSQIETDVGIGPGGVRAWFQKPVQSQIIIEAIKESVNSTLAC